ncbi:MAG: prtrc system protein e [Bacteroidetes bacterium 43-16]|uniref:PRTRC system protein E n=1 Tax=Bacteroidota TaxID=976 RepID=UPI000929ECD3|nr:MULTISPECIES: PRTRC system protein E [Bacteroidota]OJV51695.1 MAG: prtrc system protein e [Bacteroidetes bacterium 43-16]
MNTNFFNQIAQLDFTGVLQLNISKGIENSLIVSVLVLNDACGDKAKNLIPSITINATPQEFDEGFFQRITVPVQKVSGLLVDMAAFEKQMDEVKKQSAMEKDKTDKAKKEQETKDKKYKEAMAKADELEKEGKHRDAWMKVPDVTEYPEKAEEILKRKKSLSDKFAAPSLFGSMDETSQQLQPIIAENKYTEPDEEENSLEEETN